jgi:hypothetical protein
VRAGIDEEDAVLHATLHIGQRGHLGPKEREFTNGRRNHVGILASHGSSSNDHLENPPSSRYTRGCPIEARIHTAKVASMFSVSPAL